MVAIAQDSHDKIQSAGKNLLLYIFSMLKTGEIHDMNNEAWIRPTEKLLESLSALIRVERQSISFVVYEGIAQINSHALWLDRGTLEQAQELEQYLGKREAGGLLQPVETEVNPYADQIDREVVDQNAQSRHQHCADAELDQEGLTPHQVNGGAIIRPPSSASRLAPRGMVTALSAPRWRS